MFILVENGEVFAPEPLGRTSVLLAGGKIAALGLWQRDAVLRVHADANFIDATDAYVVPGFVDPHQHLIGGSGEKGFATQTPEVQLSELLKAGITTVAGCLGVDTITRTMPALLAKAKGLTEEGITAYIYSGGYNVPPVTLTGSVSRDMMLINEVIGAGEIAIADLRSTQPSAAEIARVVADAYVGGIHTRKAGVTHFHVGPEKSRLALLRDVLDRYDVQPQSLYPTHVERSVELMKEAAELTRRGATVDIDTFDEDLPKWVDVFLKERGDLNKLTVSSDSGINSPHTLHQQFSITLQELEHPLEVLLPLITSNTARVLKLFHKGRIAIGSDGDLVILERESLAIRHVIARGLVMVRDGVLQKRESSMDQSNRHILLEGRKQ